MSYQCGNVYHLLSKDWLRFVAAGAVDYCREKSPKKKETTTKQMMQKQFLDFPQNLSITYTSPAQLLNKCIVFQANLFVIEMVHKIFQQHRNKIDFLAQISIKYKFLATVRDLLSLIHPSSIWFCANIE